MNRKFRFCPYCAGPIVEEMRFNAVRPVCSACGFVQFHDPKVAVIGLVLHRGRVLLVQRAVEPGKGKWSLPGGYMDADEMPHKALQRELHEEVGLAAHIGRLLDIFQMVNDKGAAIGIVLAFRAVPANSPEIAFAADDAQAAAWYGPEDLPEDLAFESTRELLFKWIQNDGDAVADDRRTINAESNARLGRKG